MQHHSAFHLGLAVCQSNGLCMSSIYRVTVNSKIFAGILFSRIALKDIFHDYDMIYLLSPFHEDFIFMIFRKCEVSRK